MYHYEDEAFYIIEGAMTLYETLDTPKVLGPLPEQMSVHLDRGHDSEATREKRRSRGFTPEISEKGKPALMQIGKRWVVGRANSWHNAHKRLVWYTERRGRVSDFWISPLRGGHRGAQAHPRSLDSLPLGGATPPSAMTYWRKL